MKGSGGCVSGEDPCPDDLLCADVICDEELDICVVIDESDTVCPPDAYFCAINACDEEMDACVQTPKDLVDLGCDPKL